jgi:uncharacterized protein YbjT (DUF2867 family)
MKYAITGAAGHISKPLVERLLKAGHEVTSIGRNEEHLKELTKSGAHAVIGSVEDIDFLKKAFAGADAVFTMCPPNFNTKDVKGFNAMLGKNYAEAIKANKIKYAVNLSSIGAHLAEGTGPVTGLHRAEEALNTLKDVNIKHLRPAFFYSNLMTNINMIKNMGIIGSNFSIPDNKFPVSDSADIAALAAEELLSLHFSGHSVRYIVSDETGTDEIASTLGKAIGKPELKWIKFTNEQVLEGMLQAGIPKEIADEFVEMFTALNGNQFMEDYWKHHPQPGTVRLEDFAKVFADAYNANKYFF